MAMAFWERKKERGEEGGKMIKAVKVLFCFGRDAA
jgi:hypothetical protein